MGNETFSPTVVYTKEDFINRTAPFEEVYKFRGDPFKHSQVLEQMSVTAQQSGVRNFKTLYKDYCKTMQMASGHAIDNASDFEGQPLELSTGEWHADEYGISRVNGFGNTETACAHPIMPVRRLINIDTGIEKLEVAYKRSQKWRYKVFERYDLASANRIVALADYGIAVTSENAKFLVQYFNDVENYNYDRLPESNSVSRLGWIHGEGFAPYVENLVYDGNSSFKHFYDSVTQRGSADEWVRFVSKIRAEGNVPTKIVLAASFASVLVEPCNCLPFFVHLWNGSGNGKTVALMLAASVWANPAVGAYIHTFNSTDVGQELSAGFVNSLPLILDELQIQKDRRDFDRTIYKLSEGVGRVRGAKTGGVQATPTWKNCILTNGEDPILSAHSGGGAVNRIIEINTDGLNFFKDARGVAEFVSRNYGHAGKMFVEALKEPDMLETAKGYQEHFYRGLSGKDITDKQVLAASLILAADVMIEELIFHDGNELTVDDVTKFLSTHSEVSASNRAYDWLQDWIAQNAKMFDENRENGTWGKIEVGRVKIIRTVFNKECAAAGFNPKTVLSNLKQRNLIETEGKGFTKRTRICGQKCQCVVLKTDDDAPDGFEAVPDDEHVNF